ncbi:MAG: hypothetical protein RAO92_03255 [Candidatus Euphemobacter frigidus]|nr:hypothetical protein [Candidatus Euphemobacter frigidus]MDP8275398.1 hypothetical protein [Candidatus Euphemobacter frigidus]
MTENLKKMFKWTLTTIGILLITLALAEVMLRVFHHFKPLYCFYDQSYNRFRGRPLAEDWDFHLNSKGFKDVEFSEEKRADIRVLGLGDSFAYGIVPYRYNYYTRLEEILCMAGLDAEVINMGIPCVGPTAYLNLLVTEGLALKPDLVIVSFFVGNDFAEGAAFSASRNFGERTKWYEYSFVTSFIYYLASVKPHYEGQDAAGANEYIDQAPTFSEEAFLKIEKTRSYICRSDNSRLTDELNATVPELEEIQSICDRRNIGLFVLIIPDEMQVNPELQKMIVGGMPDPNRWDWSQPNKKLAEKLEILGINYLDLLKAFRDASLRTNLYKPRDTHWNIAGNELAAQIIGQELLNSKIFRISQEGKTP